MMHPTDHGLLVVLGEWDDVTAYIVEHGLDPEKIVRPNGRPLLGFGFRSHQVIFLDGWQPDWRDAAWFWEHLMPKMFGGPHAQAMIEQARRVPGLVPEAMR